MSRVFRNESVELQGVEDGVLLHFVEPRRFESVVLTNQPVARRISEPGAHTCEIVAYRVLAEPIVDTSTVKAKVWRLIESYGIQVRQPRSRKVFPIRSGHRRDVWVSGAMKDDEDWLLAPNIYAGDWPPAGNVNRNGQPCRNPVGIPVTKLDAAGRVVRQNSYCFLYGRCTGSRVYSLPRG
jgi:hypothetical protein